MTKEYLATSCLGVNTASMNQTIKTLGILGGGQLGRMSAMAAARLGIRTHIYAPEQNAIAFDVSHEMTCAPYNDTKALEAFAKSVDVISYEFENIPVETVRTLKRYASVWPDDTLLSIAQNRLAEKQFLNDIGVETAQWAPIHGPNDIESIVAKWGCDALILKTTRFGYDGKGQLKHRAGDKASKSWEKLGKVELIAESIVDFAYEISVVIARDQMGGVALYPAVLNEHKDHILHKTHAPAPIPPEQAQAAQDAARQLAERVNLVGVLALELFVTKDGLILANEIAPRTHNSGHWSIDACAVSQFENHVRAVCGLPVGEPAPFVPAVMLNLIGDDVNDVPKHLVTPGACVHLYGKDEAKPGRKMGHVTFLGKNE